MANKILKFVLLFTMITFLVVFLYTPKTHCQTCRFEVNGENLTVEKFMEVYQEECFRTYNVLGMGVQNPLNISMGSQ